MKTASALVALVLLARCAGRQPALGGKPAPYTAVVAFVWQGEPQAAGAEEITPSALRFREWVEDEIVAGLEEFRVFSDFRPVEPDRLEADAREEEADLIVRISITTLAEQTEEATRWVPDLAALEVFLWLATYFGALWVPDVEFPTRSEVAVEWDRPRRDGGPSPRAGDGKDDFTRWENLSTSRDYRLSLWDRAKPWRSPWAYLLSAVIPPALVPIQDHEELRLALVVEAIEDIKRELALTFQGRQLRSDGGPFLFRLEEPPNGSTVAGGPVRLLYRYRIDPAFREHRLTRLSELQVGLKRDGEPGFRRIRNYTGEEIREINARIAGDETIEENVDAMELGPGRNLVRFVARTALEGRWITNTVVLLRP